MYSRDEQKNYALDNLITPTRKTVFEDSDVEDNEEVGFDPPPMITADILSQTPVIRLTTPIRDRSGSRDRAGSREKDDFSIP